MVHYVVGAPPLGELLTTSCFCFRCRSKSPPPILLSVKESCHSQNNRIEEASHINLQLQKNWSLKTSHLHGGSELSTEFESRLTKARSIGCLDKRLSIYKPPRGEEQEHKENQPQEGGPADCAVFPGALSWSTLSLASSAKHSHNRTLSLSRPRSGTSSATIRKKISEWECRNVALPRMSLCLDKRPGGGSEGCSSLLSSPCSEKAFDFKGIRRMSTGFSECSYPETEEEEGTSDRESHARFQKRKTSKTETSGNVRRNLHPRKETSAVLNRIQKIEQALKDNPSHAAPRYLSNCYGLDKSGQKSRTFSTLHGMDDLVSTCGSKRSSICSVATEPDTCSGSERLSKFRQRYSVTSFMSECSELPSAQGSSGTPINPLPKPKRTFEYDVNRNHKDSSGNGLIRSIDTCGPLSCSSGSVKQDKKTTDSSFKRSQHG